VKKSKLFLVVGLAFISSVILFIAVSAVGAMSLPGECVAGIVCFLALTWILLQTVTVSAKAYITVAILSGICVFQVPVRLAYWNDTMISLPPFCCQLFGVLAGWVIYKIHGWSKGFPIVFSALVGLWMFWAGMDFWLFKMNFGTFTGNVQLTPPGHLQAYDAKGRLVDLASDRGNVILLDFWYTGCRVCFREFPQVQKYYDSLKNRTGVSLYAVNWPVRRDSVGQAFQMIQARKYSFPVLVLADSTLPERLGITSYPTMIVMDRRQKIVYRGDLKGAERVIAELL
jgi:thiol-disulfide isomerase/thioredoxin